MKIPWVAGRVLTKDEFDCYCRSALEVWRRGGIRLEDYKEVLLDFPLLMKPGELPRLARLAETLTQELLAAEMELLSRPDLFRLLGLPARIEKILGGCGPGCLTKGVPRVLRFDFHLTTEGWKFSEPNPDTAGGFVEAYGYTEPMARYYPGYSPPPNPAAAYAQAIRDTVGRDTLIAMALRGDDPYSARQADFLIKEFGTQGLRAILVAPGRLRWKSGVARFARSSGAGIPRLIVRQLAVNELLRLRLPSDWTHLFCGARTPVSNPGFSLLTGSKCFPCVLRELDVATPAFCSYSPESRRLDEVPAVSRHQWVYKPAYGSSGRGIAVAGVTKNLAFDATVERARRHPLKWVAQRRFESVPVLTERGPGHVCLGIYTINGAFSGIYARIKGNALIDSRSLSIPVLIPEADVAPSKISRRSAVRN